MDSEAPPIFSMYKYLLSHCSHDQTAETLSYGMTEKTTNSYPLSLKCYKLKYSTIQCDDWKKYKQYKCHLKLEHEITSSHKTNVMLRYVANPMISIKL